MKKEELILLGLDEEIAKKVEAASNEELKGYIPKSRFDEVNNAKKETEKQLSERDKQLEELKKSSGDSEALKSQITQLQEENKATKEKYETDMKEEKLKTAIKLAISNKVHDEDLVSGLFDRTKLILSDDGKVTGLDEQFKTIKETKAFLFKEDGQKKKQAYIPKAGGTNEVSLAKTIAESRNAETTDNPYAKAWS